MSLKMTLPHRDMEDNWHMLIVYRKALLPQEALQYGRLNLQTPNVNYS